MSIFALLLHHTCAFQVNFHEHSFCYFSKYQKLSLLRIHSTPCPGSPSSAFVSRNFLHPRSPLDPGARIECLAKAGVEISCPLWPKLLSTALVCSGWNDQHAVYEQILKMNNLFQQFFNSVWCHLFVSVYILASLPIRSSQSLLSGEGVQNLHLNLQTN